MRSTAPANSFTLILVTEENLGGITRFIVRKFAFD